MTNRANTAIIIATVCAIVATICATTEAKAWISNEDKIRLNETTTDGKLTHTWLLRPQADPTGQQKVCLNGTSDFGIMKQHEWETEKQDFKTNKTTSLNFLDNPWPLLCSTPEGQARDYYGKYVIHNIP